MDSSPPMFPDQDNCNQSSCLCYVCFHIIIALSSSFLAPILYITSFTLSYRGYHLLAIYNYLPEPYYLLHPEEQIYQLLGHFHYRSSNIQDA